MRPITLLISIISFGVLFYFFKFDLVIFLFFGYIIFVLAFISIPVLYEFIVRPAKRPAQADTNERAQEVLRQIREGENPRFRLFLRRFEEEQAAFCMENHSIFDGIPLKIPVSAHQSIDLCFDKSAPTVVISVDHQSRMPGLGVLNLGSENWQEIVEILIKNAEIIFFLQPILKSDGIEFEQKLIDKAGAVQKTIFIFSNEFIKSTQMIYSATSNFGDFSFLEELGWPNFVTFSDRAEAHRSTRRALEYLLKGPVTQAQITTLPGQYKGKVVAGRKPKGSNRR